MRFPSVLQHHSPTMPSFQSSLNFSAVANVDHGELSLFHVGSMVDEVSVQIGKTGHDVVLMCLSCSHRSTLAMATPASRTSMTIPFSIPWASMHYSM